MRQTIVLVASVVLTLAVASGCGEKKTIVRRETVQTVPAAPVVVEKRTHTVEETTD